MLADQEQIISFQEKIWTFYSRHGRRLPWRDDTSPFSVLVSEIMLQQTQVSRVIPKYTDFIERFSDMESLASATQAEVLRSWQGLGYNRRARFLHKAAQRIVAQYKGVLPADVAMLERLPGIGPATARSIAVFAYNQPLVFIETNIRSVFLYEFFPDQESVEDTTLWPYLEATLEEADPRQWYWALMDYGSYLKRTVGNPGRRSWHYNRQTPFTSSRRRVRGLVLQALSQQSYTWEQLQQVVSDERLSDVVADLRTEGFIAKHGHNWRLQD